VKPLRSAPAVGLVLLAACFPAARPARPEPVRTDILADLPGVADIAAPANGQTLYVLEQPGGAVIAVDPAKAGRRWTALAAATPPAAGSRRRPLALACIDTTRLAVLCLEDDRYVLRVHAVQPDVTAASEDPEQVVPIGGTVPAGEAAPRPAAPVSATVVLGPARDWIAVCGLPPPLPGVLRAPIHGGRIGLLSAAGCPTVSPHAVPTAAAASPDDELVLFAPDGPARSATTHLAFHRAPQSRRLLHLDTGLPSVRDAAFCRGDGTLWAVGGAAGSPTAPEGLWRIDGVVVQGRQGVRAAAVVPLEAPRAVCCLSERAIAVAHGRGMVTLFDPAPRPAAGPVEEGK
jgi:hypothetical protein